jgi:hypothetical protein
MKAFLIFMGAAILCAISAVWYGHTDSYKTWDAARHAEWRRVSGQQRQTLKEAEFTGITNGSYYGQFFAEKSGQMFEINFKDNATHIITMRAINRK